MRYIDNNTEPTYNSFQVVTGVALAGAVFIVGVIFVVGALRAIF